MMGHDAMFQVLQSSFLGRLLTGNPFIDVCLTACLVPLTSWLFTRSYDVLQQLMRNFVFCQGIQPQQIIDIPSNSLRRYDDNTVYEDFIWYISTVHPPVQGQFKAFKEEDQHIFPVADAVTCTTSWNEFEFQYKFYTTKPESVSEHTERGVQVFLDHPTVRPLKDFLVDIAKLREASEKEKEWRQTLCTASDEGWSKEKETHNRKTLDTVVLNEGVKDALQRDIESFLDSEDWYTKMGLSWTRGYLLSGPSGTGKTSIIKALSYQYKLDIYVVDLSNISSDEKLASLFDVIPPRSMVVLEDVDCMSDITHRRTPDEEKACENKLEHEGPMPKQSCVKVNLSSVTLSGLLNVLDGVVSPHGRVLIMTSNHPEKLDPALTRSGRVDMKISLGPCGLHQIRELFQIYFKEDLPSAAAKLLDSCKISPADVTSQFLTHRRDSMMALDSLVSHSCEKAVDV